MVNSYMPIPQKDITI